MVPLLSPNGYGMAMQMIIVSKIKITRDIQTQLLLCLTFDVFSLSILNILRAKYIYILIFYFINFSILINDSKNFND